MLAFVLIAPLLHGLVIVDGPPPHRIEASHGNALHVTSILSAMNRYETHKVDVTSLRKCHDTIPSFFFKIPLQFKIQAFSQIKAPTRMYQE